MIGKPELNRNISDVATTLDTQPNVIIHKRGTMVAVQGVVAMNSQRISITLPYKAIEQTWFPVIGLNSSSEPTTGYTGRGVITKNNNAMDIVLAGANTFGCLNFSYKTKG